MDGGNWNDRNEPLPEWGRAATDWIREDLLIRDLPEGPHHMEIEPLFASGAAGSSFPLCTIGIIR